MRLIMLLCRQYRGDVLAGMPVTWPVTKPLQPLSARCHAYIACSSAPGWGHTHCQLCWAGAQGFLPGQRLCQRCNLHAAHDAPHDEQHLVFECPAMQLFECPAMAMQCDRYPALFSTATNTMQLFMWQRNIVVVAHFQDCFEVLGALDDAPVMHQPHLHQPWRPDRCNPFIHAMFSPANNTMQLFMWQRNVVGVAQFVKDCFEVLGALDDASDDASTSSSSALAAV